MDTKTFSDNQDNVQNLTPKKERKLVPQVLHGKALLEFIHDLSDKVEWLADGFIAEPSITMLYATDGIGKSVIGIQSAVELANGLPVFKSFHVDKPLKVIYCPAERSIKEPLKRIKRMLTDPDYKDMHFDNFKITTEFQGKDVSDKTVSQSLIECLDRHSKELGGCDVVFFDPLYALVKKDLKSDEAVSGVFDFFRRIGNELGANVFFLHHENRGTRLQGETARSGQDYYGNKFISGLCTAVWHMVKESDFKTVIVNEKDSESALIPRMVLEYCPEFSTVRADVKSSPKGKEILIEAFLKKAKEESIEFEQDKLFTETGIKLHPVSKRKLIAGLVSDGVIKNISVNGKKGKYVCI